jgi:hypothetical protein
MQDKLANSCAQELFVKPAGMADEEWYAIDLNDPLMQVC